MHIQMIRSRLCDCYILLSIKMTYNARINVLVHFNYIIIRTVHRVFVFLEVVRRGTMAPNPAKSTTNHITTINI